ncbi:phosphate import ATP-binding protein PstB 2 [Gottschalkia purinilytica]|uniref:Phosphate import ATP-binding protein PstB 2 n=1 Tax=Gottschalkia purinilytica TaxID=1503 RepID=A0A0L0W7V7_GOTPU|nr:phosphate ABC transporter ATP-binding protein [Gottschalkia purinilytica]KNF07521.1 phosphate import ATP-binding protein PstB 2 [Gottschalkia purinilytica]
MSILTIEKLSVYYEKKNILKEISMNIHKHKITSIIGPSGCGKSTLLLSLNLMIENLGGKIEGEVKFNEKDILDIPKEELRKKVGIVFQKPTPFPLSIYKNLTYAPIYYGIKDKATLDKIAKDKLKICNLYDEIHEDMNMSALNLSGGQQQRLCIARTLTVEPEVILLDEPCSALDIKNTENIETMLTNLSERYTIVIVTHNLSQAKRISDYTAFMLNGELIEFGTTKEIFENPRDKRTKEYIEGIYG